MQCNADSFTLAHSHDSLNEEKKERERERGGGGKEHSIILFCVSLKKSWYLQAIIPRVQQARDCDNQSEGIRPADQSEERAGANCHQLPSCLICTLSAVVQQVKT